MIESILDRLKPHLRLDDVAVTGGVAIDIGMEGLRAPRTRGRAADLDLVARAVDVVDPAVTKDFLVSHYHVVGPGVLKFMIQLVDPSIRIRVDIFPDLAGSIARARCVRIGPHQVRVLTLEDILDHKLQTLSKASPERPVDPKHLRDARAIARLLGRTAAKIDSRCLAEDAYGETEDGCVRCESSRRPEFPLAQPHKIAALLGWTVNVREPAVNRATLRVTRNACNVEPAHAWRRRRD